MHFASALSPHSVQVNLTERKATKTAPLGQTGGSAAPVLP